MLPIVGGRGPGPRHGGIQYIYTYIVVRDLQAAILPIDGGRGPGSGHGGLQ